MQISLSSPELLTFFWNSRWRQPPSWIFRLCEFGYSGMLIVWYLCSTKFGSNIYYSHWDRRTYASDFHLMTSCELTSRCDLWSRGHFRMAVVHLHIKFGAEIFIRCGVIDIFPTFKMAAAAILDFQIMCIWPIGCVDSVVFVLCTKLG